ncbi:MAG: sigma-70 family RNA polymerase sigma factor [Myxococcales bacterium]|nr:sigma-70 family RNA polymerase sigma factor [Myxococcales bacterium]
MSGSGGALTDEAELAPLPDERAVVERLRQGDRAAAGTLYVWYGTPLFREVILPRLPNREQAEDVLRDTFRAVLERIETYHPDENKSIYFWLRRIAINRTTDVHRANLRTKKLEAAIEAEARIHGAASTDADQGRGIESDDTREQIEQALQRLNPRYAEALRLRLLREHSREDCAARMGVTVGNFDVILHRASAAFRNAYTPTTGHASRD